MRSAAISKLKASLSEFLDRVKAGEEIIVTERGKPIARIVPVTGDRTAVPAHIASLERAGLARVGSGKLPKDFWEWPRPEDPEGLALKALLDERETGR
jgi:prevent-host-death family protein